jgi:hypothetical protein
MTDELPSATEPDDDVLDDPWHDHIVEAGDSFGAPEVQAVVAFVLAVVSLLGYGLLAGGLYFYFSTPSAADDLRTRNVLASVLGAVFALVPVVLGWRASARTLPSDARWVGPLARAAVLLGLIAVVLRLVLAVLAASSGDAGSRFVTF